MFMLKSTHHEELSKAYDIAIFWKRRADGLELALKRLTNTNKKPELDDKTIRRLLQLCHPDKHGNSPASVEITQLLISMRK